MKNQALFSSKDKSKRLKCRLLQFLFSALRVKLNFTACNSLGQFCVLQAELSSGSPTQSAPEYCGGIQVRFRLFVPPAHVAVHVVHVLHVVKYPSTEMEIKVCVSL